VYVLETEEKVPQVFWIDIDYQDSSIFSNDYKVEVLDWMLEWFNGSSWTIYDSGKTASDGLIGKVDSTARINYKKRVAN
jgi:hypothetical protein